VRILDRYILREFALPLVGGIGLFVFALVMDRLFDLLDLVLNRGVSAFTVAALMACLLPSIIAVALPMACLLASVLAFGRMAHDREVVAMKVAGLGMFRMTAPLVGAGAVMSLVLLAFNGTVLPSANMAYKRLFFSIIQQRATVTLRERVFVREFDSFLLYFNSKEGKEGVLKDVTIVEDGQVPPRIITAERGRLEVDREALKVKLVLENGTADQPQDIEGGQYSRIGFSSYEKELDIQQYISGGPLSSKAMSEMNYRDLWVRLRELRAVPEQRRAYEVEFQQRLALALAPFFVMFIGAPLGALARRGGGVGIVISLLVIFVYYFMMTLGRGFADRGQLAVWAGVWLPNAVLAVAGGLVFWASSRELKWIRWGR